MFFETPQKFFQNLSAKCTRNLFRMFQIKKKETTINHDIMIHYLLSCIILFLK